MKYSYLKKNRIWPGAFFLWLEGELDSCQSFLL